MKRSIQRQFYLIALLPFAALALGLIIFNASKRIEEVRRQLEDSRQMTIELLSGPAEEALVIGNTLTFNRLVTDVHTRTAMIQCISLLDNAGTIVSEVGECAEETVSRRYEPISSRPGELSDLPDDSAQKQVVGSLQVAMRQGEVTKRIQSVVWQLAASLVALLLMSYVISRLIRARLVEPIQKIERTMQAVSDRDYGSRIEVRGNDELSRLASAINTTIDTVQSYTRELEERKKDAEGALHDADEATLAKNAMVRSLTEDLQGPVTAMHDELTNIAIHNRDMELKEPIKSLMTLLQDTEGNVSDVIAVANSESPSTHYVRPRELGELVADLEWELQRLSEQIDVSVHFVAPQIANISGLPAERTGIYLSLDSMRLRKALLRIVRALSNDCSDAGVHVTVQLIKLDDQRLNLSIQLKAFNEPDLTAPRFGLPVVHSEFSPLILGWSNRESEIVQHYLRALETSPLYSTSPDGTINLLLDIVCSYRVSRSDDGGLPDSIRQAEPIHAAIVTDDETVARLAERGDVINHDLIVSSFGHAVDDMKLLRRQDALLIDINHDDLAPALRLVAALTAEGVDGPKLIAICPPGRISDALGDRLFDLGFAGIAQKPLKLAPLVEVLRIALANPLSKIVPTLGQ